MSQISAWDRVTIARNPNRVKALDIVPLLFDHFFECAGDRHFGDDKALIGGIALFEGIPVTVLAQSKGRTLDENMKCNFGMLHPEGYRKALRLMKQAEKFKRPIITFIDTPGLVDGAMAYPFDVEQAILWLGLFTEKKTKVFL